jgi:hypothetical protein
MGRRKAAGTRLEQAKAAHAEAKLKIGELEAARNDALLADRDDDAARLDAELETLQRLLRGYRDKIGLLEFEAEREEAADRVRHHEAHIQQVEKLGDNLIAAGVKLAEATAVIVVAYRAAIAAAERRAAAWPWAPQDQSAAMLTAQSIHDALAHEFFRTSRVPFLGGKPGEKIVPSLPGAACSRMTDWLNLPERETPLVDAFKESAAYASRRMRETAAQPMPLAANGKGATPPPAPAAIEAPPVPPLAEPGELSGLLARQAELANDITPEGEKAYQKIVARIAQLQ